MYIFTKYVYTIQPTEPINENVFCAASSNTPHFDTRKPWTFGFFTSKNSSSREILGFILSS